jgi:hypothetical protein
MMVQFEAFDTIVGERAIDSLRKGAGKQIEIIAKSGKLKGGAIYATKRGGFLLLEVAQGTIAIIYRGTQRVTHRIKT